jgi:hypothetical protein
MPPCAPTTAGGAPASLTRIIGNLPRPSLLTMSAYSHLISLPKLRTHSHHRDIERLRHVTLGITRSRRARPWCRTPDAMHDELQCIMERFPHPSQPKAKACVEPCLHLVRGLAGICARCLLLRAWLALLRGAYTALTKSKRRGI